VTTGIRPQLPQPPPDWDRNGRTSHAQQLSWLIQSCWAGKPEQRPQLGEVVQLLKALL
jgi:hypothetical protein